MARTRWPPGPVNPGLLHRTGRSGQQRRWVPQRAWAPAGRSIRRTTSRRQPIRRPSRDPGPTPSPHHPKAAEAEPNRYLHPPCRFWAADISQARPLGRAPISQFWVGRCAGLHAAAGAERLTAVAAGAAGVDLGPRGDGGPDPSRARRSGDGRRSDICHPELVRRGTTRRDSVRPRWLHGSSQRSGRGDRSVPAVEVLRPGACGAVDRPDDHCR